MEAKPIIGEAYRDLKFLVGNCAKKNYPILLIGETGTGKELFADLYKSSSGLQGGKMTVNCAGVPDELLSSEVFGHVKGAFTGATANRKGKLAACKNGILFLDELGDASQRFQAAILRVVEFNSFSPVGADKEDKAETVIIAATSKLNAIRLDLSNRFHTFFIPPLQKCDIPALAKHFFDGKKVKKEILDKLMQLEYPGNVRELKKICEKELIERGDVIFAEHGDYLLPMNTFDYSRYKVEIETWHQHIQPILDSNQIYEFKYAYQEWNDEWDSDVNDKNIQTKLLTCGRLSVWETAPSRDNDPCVYGILKLIKWLSKGMDKEKDLPSDQDVYPPLKPNDLLPMFHRHLRELIEIRSLPYLLKYLHQEYCCKPIVCREKPSISFLLDLSPDAAINKFQNIYYMYYLRLNNGSVNAAASVLNLNKNTLKSRLRRLKIDSF